MSAIDEILDKRKIYTRIYNDYCDSFYISFNNVITAETEYIKICRLYYYDALEIKTASHILFMITNRDKIGMTENDISNIESCWISVKRQQARHGNDEIRSKFIEENIDDDVLLEICYRLGSDDIKEKIIKKIKTHHEKLIKTIINYSTNPKHICIAKMFMK